MCGITLVPGPLPELETNGVCGSIELLAYLWQEPFLNRLSDAVVNRFPLNLALAFLTALACYYVVERPFLDMRRFVDNWLTQRRPNVHLEARAPDALVKS